MHVLGICGSLRRGSYNRMLLLAAARYLPRGCDLELLEGLDEIPPYNEDRDIAPAPACVRRLRNAIEEAHALLIATPEYNASPPGCSQERARLGVAPVSAELPPGETSRGRRRQHRRLRRRLGAGRAAQGAEGGRRDGDPE